MLINWKTMFDRCYCIISTKCSIKFAKKMWHYSLLTFDSQRLSLFYLLLLMSVCQVRVQQSIQDGRHRPIRPDVSEKGPF